MFLLLLYHKATSLLKNLLQISILNISCENYRVKPGSQLIFKGRPKISVGQQILNITQPKHFVILFQKHKLEVDHFKKG